MQRLKVHNFGPIGDATVDVEPILVLIGPQGSGKSTISKLVYYFLHVRDEVTAFIIEAAETGDLDNAEWRLYKRLRNRFVEFWGPTPQLPDVSISYQYGPEHSMHITLDKDQHRYVTPRFAPETWNQIREVLREARSHFGDGSARSTFLSAVGKLAAERQRSVALELVRDKCAAIFGYDKELLFIPAGRSVLSTLADQIQYIHPHKLDYPMRQFVETINASNAYFGRSLDDLVREKQALSSASIWFSVVRKSQTYVRRILKGEYRHDAEGGKLFITPTIFTKINYASSGQQEAVWILLSLFLLVLERSKALVVIEEPEAHLFPDAQNEIVRFITLVHNTIGCDFIITTHSPYLLECMNNLLYASDLARSVSPGAVEQVVPKESWLDPAKVSGYFVADGGVTPLIAEGVPAFRSELLDSVTEKINDEYQSLLSLERGE